MGKLVNGKFVRRSAYECRHGKAPKDCRLCNIVRLMNRLARKEGS